MVPVVGQTGQARADTRGRCAAHRRPPRRARRARRGGCGQPGTTVDQLRGLQERQPTGAEVVQQRPERLGPHATDGLHRSPRAGSRSTRPQPWLVDTAHAVDRDLLDEGLLGHRSRDVLLLAMCPPGGPGRIGRSRRSCPQESGRAVRSRAADRPPRRAPAGAQGMTGRCCTSSPRRLAGRPAAALSRLRRRVRPPVDAGAGAAARRPALRAHRPAAARRRPHRLDVGSNSAAHDPPGCGSRTPTARSRSAVVAVAVPPGSDGTSRSAGAARALIGSGLPDRRVRAPPRVTVFRLGWAVTAPSVRLDPPAHAKGLRCRSTNCSSRSRSRSSTRSRGR